MGSEMKILYVSRNQNQSGYAILRELIRAGLTPSGVMLPQRELLNESRAGLWLLKNAYLFQSKLENSKPLRFLESEFRLAEDAGIPILRTSSVDVDERILREIRDARYDIIFLGGGWPGLLPAHFIELGRLGALNTHPSLLPAFRGTSVTRWQILEGVPKSGVTIHAVNEKFDSGPTLAQAELICLPGEAPQELFGRLSKLASQLAVKLLTEVQASGRLPKAITLEGRGSYYPKWDWDAANIRIDFSDSLQSVHQFILASTQESYKYGGPRIRLNNRDFFLRETAVVAAKGVARDGLPDGDGLHLSLDDHGFMLLSKLGDPDCLLIKKIQPKKGRIGLSRARRPGKFFSKDEKIERSG